MSLRVAVIGTGWADLVQIPAFQAGGLELVGVAGRDPEKTARVAKAHGVPMATADWRDLLELDCDLISVTSPPTFHKQQSLAILEAGKHLICEKPLALNGEEAREMAAAASRHPEQLALVDHELRFTPVRRKAKELLAAGAIGRVLTVTARVATPDRIDPHKAWNWWSDASQGGGILGALGSHVLDGIRWLLDSEIVISGATLGTIYPEREDETGQPRKVTADELVSATFSVGGAVGTMLVHGAALTEATDLLTLRGTDGTLVIDRSLKLYLSKGQGPLKEYVTQLPGIVPNRFRSSPYAAGSVLFAQALADALEPGGQGREALTQAATLQDGYAVQRLIDDIRSKAGARG